MAVLSLKMYVLSLAESSSGDLHRTGIEGGIHEHEHEHEGSDERTLVKQILFTSSNCSDTAVEISQIF